MKDNARSDLEVLLMQPKDVPEQLLTALSKFFNKRDNINKAYFALAQFSNSLESPDFLIAIDADIDASREIGEVKKYLAYNSLDTGGVRVAIVDVAQKPFSVYFSKKQAFYVS